MNLYLLRHADADTVAESDEARFLSERGLAQARKVARFCDVQAFQISLVLTSPIRRAHETALIVSAHLRSKMVIAPWLASGMSASTGAEELRAYREEPGVMLVGHEPDFGQLAAHLLGLPGSESIRIRKASLTLIELETADAGTARLLFSIPCKLM